MIVDMSRLTSTRVDDYGRPLTIVSLVGPSGRIPVVMETDAARCDDCGLRMPRGERAVYHWGRRPPYDDPLSSHLVERHWIVCFACSRKKGER